MPRECKEAHVSQIATEAPRSWAEETTEGETDWPVGTVRLGVDGPLHRYPPVLALTFLRQVADREQVLVGVRTKHNGSHQNVMSVPTMRVLPEVAARWARPLADGMLSADQIGWSRSIERTVRHVVREILALKARKQDRP